MEVLDGDNLKEVYNFHDLVEARDLQEPEEEIKIDYESEEEEIKINYVPQKESCQFMYQQDFAMGASDPIEIPAVRSKPQRFILRKDSVEIKEDSVEIEEESAEIEEDSV